MLKQAIAEQLANLQEDATVKQRLRKIGNTLLSHRQLSQQEAAFLVIGLHLKGSSRATVFVSALPKCQQTRLVRPSYQLQELDDIDTNVFMHGLIDRYAARPTMGPFDSMTLAHFAVWYHTVCGSRRMKPKPLPVIFLAFSCKMVWVQLLRDGTRLA